MAMIIEASDKAKNIALSARTRSGLGSQPDLWWHPDKRDLLSRQSKALYLELCNSLICKQKHRIYIM